MSLPINYNPQKPHFEINFPCHEVVAANIYLLAATCIHVIQSTRTQNSLRMLAFNMLASDEYVNKEFATYLKKVAYATELLGSQSDASLTDVMKNAANMVLSVYSSDLLTKYPEIIYYLDVELVSRAKTVVQRYFDIFNVISTEIAPKYTHRVINTAGAGRQNGVGGSFANMVAGGGAVSHGRQNIASPFALTSNQSRPYTKDSVLSRKPVFNLRGGSEADSVIADNNTKQEVVTEKLQTAVVEKTSKNKKFLWDLTGSDTSPDPEVIDKTAEPQFSMPTVTPVQETPTELVESDADGEVKEVTYEDKLAAYQQLLINEKQPGRVHPYYDVAFVPNAETHEPPAFDPNIDICYYVDSLDPKDKSLTTYVLMADGSATVDLDRLLAVPRVISDSTQTLIRSSVSESIAIRGSLAVELGEIKDTIQQAEDLDEDLSVKLMLGNPVITAHGSMWARNNIAQSIVGENKTSVVISSAVYLDVIAGGQNVSGLMESIYNCTTFAEVSDLMLDEIKKTAAAKPGHHSKNILNKVDAYLTRRLQTALEDEFCVTATKINSFSREVLEVNKWFETKPTLNIWYKESQNRFIKTNCSQLPDDAAVASLRDIFDEFGDEEDITAENFAVLYRHCYYASISCTFEELRLELAAKVGGNLLSSNDDSPVLDLSKTMKDIAESKKSDSSGYEMYIQTIDGHTVRVVESPTQADVFLISMTKH